MKIYGKISMHRIIVFLKEEFIKVIPAIIFFAIAFNLIVFTDNLLLHNRQMPQESYLTATFAALVVGKFLLIVNQFGFVNLFPQKPLIYNISWKIFIYGSLALLFRIVEKLFDFSFEYHHSKTITQHLANLMESPNFWAMQMWIFILFIVYVVACEFIRVLGAEKVKTLLLGNKRFSRN